MSSISAARDRRKERHLGAIGQHNIRRRHDLIHGHAHRAALGQAFGPGRAARDQFGAQRGERGGPGGDALAVLATASRIEAK